MFSLVMQVLDNFILSLGFYSQDDNLSRDRKGYKSFHSMIDPYSHHPHFVFYRNSKEGWHDQQIDQIGPFQPPV